MPTKGFRSRIDFRSRISFRSRIGFTLVELLIAVSILGVLVGAVIVVINPAGVLKRSRDAKCKSDLQLIHTALEFFHQNNTVYPDFSLCTEITSTEDLGLVSGGYIKQIPTAPDGGGYYYISSDSGAQFKLVTKLEISGNYDNKQCDSGVVTACSAIVDDNHCYKISNTF